MSGIAKGIKKVFRAVGKVIKKVAAPLLAVGAIVFTAGAALGLAPLAGGFGGAVSSALGAVGISGGGTLATALTGAVTQAGYGAAIGGVGSMVTGGKFEDGAAAGALAGAVTGGATGLMRGAATAADPSVTASSRNLPTTSSGPLARPVTANGLASSGPAANVAQVAQPNGLMSRAGDFLSNPIVGQTIAGIGNGLMTGMAAKEQAQAQEDQFNRVSESYNVDPSVYDSAPRPDGTARPRPRAKYNRETRRIEYS